MTMATLPPRHVCIAGALFIALSAWAAVGVIASWLNGRAGLDLTILFLPVGYGIILGNASARNWGRLLAIIGVLLSLIGSLFIGFDLYNMAGGPLPPGEVVEFAGCILYLAACAYAYMVLRRSGYDAWFQDMQSNTAAAKSLLWAVAVISVSAAALYHLQIWQVNQTDKNSFIYHVVVKPYDKVTGNELSVAGFSASDFEEANGNPTGSPRPSLLLRSTRELEAIGVAARSFEFKLMCVGYRDHMVRVERGAGGVIDVPMEPLALAGSDAGEESAK